MIEINYGIVPVNNLFILICPFLLAIISFWIGTLLRKIYDKGVGKYGKNNR